jgi:hypothetical protein
MWDMEFTAPNASVRDIFDMMRDGLRNRRPSGYRNGAGVDGEPVRLQVYWAEPYIGINRYVPPTVQEYLLETHMSLDDFMAEADPFLKRLYNPKRIAWMEPTPFGFREMEGLFARSPSQSQFMEHRFQAFLEAYPYAFSVDLD